MHVRTMTIGAMAAVITAVTTTAAAASCPADQRTLVAYEKSGGIAGVNERVIVDDDGTAHVIRHTTSDVRLTDDELSALRGKLDGIWRWQSSTAGCDISDHFTYTLTYSGRHATRCHTVPADWQAAVAQLDGLIHGSAPERLRLGPPRLMVLPVGRCGWVHAGW